MNLKVTYGPKNTVLKTKSQLIIQRAVILYISTTQHILYAQTLNLEASFKTYLNSTTK